MIQKKLKIRCPYCKAVMDGSFTLRESSQDWVGKIEVWLDGKLAQRDLFYKLDEKTRRKFRCLKCLENFDVKLLTGIEVKTNKGVVRRINREARKAQPLLPAIEEVQE